MSMAPLKHGDGNPRYDVQPRRSMVSHGLRFPVSEDRAVQVWIPSRGAGTAMSLPNPFKPSRSATGRYLLDRLAAGDV